MQQLNLTISELHAQYRAGSYTPEAVISQLRKQAEAQQSVWIHLLTEQELAPYMANLAGKSPDTHPLFGIPFAIKDNIDLAGVPTTAACPEFAYTPSQSAFVVEQLIAAGAIPLGKTNLDQFATGLVGTRSPYGETANSFDPEYISGGSSSGSAVATASGIVSFALGTDTAGSGRVPACFNNLVGVKPSKGLLSNRGLVPACKSIDCISIFALTAADANIVLNLAAQFDQQDSYARVNPIANQRPVRAKKQFSFAIPKKSQLEFFADSDYQHAFEQAINSLQQLGGEAIELDFTPCFEAAKLLYEGPWVAERYLATEALITSKPDALLAVTRNIISAGSKPLALDCFKAQYQLQHFKQQADQLLQQADFMVTPTAGRHFTRDEINEQPIVRNSQLGYYTNFMNLLDFAAVAVPTSFTQHGRPFGITLFSHAMTDQMLLSYSDKIMQANKLPLGATEFPFVSQPLERDSNQGYIDIAVCGAHLSAMVLNHQLTDRGARLITKTRSAKCYKMFAIAGSVERPGMVKVGKEQGCDFELEVWRMQVEHLASFLQSIAEPLALGQVELADGSLVTGFVAQSQALDGVDISQYGSWRSYIASKA